MKPLPFAALFGSLHLLLALVVQGSGYPHEDAYILFKYARHVAAGLGSVYFPGGPRVEGATDFLWMLGLAALNRAGLEVALAAAVLSAIGFALVSRRIFIAVTEEHANATEALLLSLFFAALWLVHPASVAGALGFSATLFAALSLELYVALTKSRPMAVLGFATVLALLRPDGVVLGAASVAVAALYAWRNGPRRRFFLSLVGALALGAAYFGARARYFDTLLPLPLIVKSHHGPMPPGLWEAADWASSTLLPMTIGGVLLAAVTRRYAAPSSAMALAPFVVHVLAFIPSFPSQNIANRFQAPFAVVLFFLVCKMAAYAVERHRRATPVARAARAFAVLGLAVVVLAPQGLVAFRALREPFLPDYVNPFSVHLAKLSEQRTRGGAPPLKVASTEAGRILYFTQGPVLDLVGLNSRETAERAPSRALLEAFDADVIMFHHASGMNEDQMEATGVDVFGKGPATTTTPVVRLTEPLWRYVHPWNALYLDAALKPYRELFADNVRVAPIATAGWLDEVGDRYEHYAVRFEARFARRHVYAIRRGLREREAILMELFRCHEPLLHGSHWAAVKLLRRE
ncbi:MAG: hypothetical protein IPG50_33255 [Myxococcales bacterium]|nr:hypothetical protein [Myxococcales bacterium]